VVRPGTKVGCEDWLQVVESGSRYLQILKFVVLERMPMGIEQPAGAPVIVVWAVIRKGVLRLPQLEVVGVRVLLMLSKGVY
jgi:hypothetical protein